VYRRYVQRSYLDNMDRGLNSTGGAEEVRALFKGELRALDAELKAALPAATDELTRRHLLDSRDEIATALDPLVPRPAAAGAGGRGGRGGIR
jgi:hypothetical protein